MHNTAREYGRIFFETYGYIKTNLTIVDIGSLDINGALRDYASPGSNYIGLDFATGKSVDIVLQDAYHFPLPDNYADIVVTSSCFEHSQFFWLTFMEAIRILKPEGVMYLSAPSNGPYHRHPTDNWRFYPDAAIALSEYAHYTQHLNVMVLESFIGNRCNEVWNDFVAVFIKDAQYSHIYQNRIYLNVPECLTPKNIWVNGNKEIINRQDNMIDIDENFHDIYVFMAASKGELQFVQNNIGKVININYLYDIGATALYMAVQSGYFGIVKILLEAGADTEIKAKNNYYPLYASVENNDLKTATLLIEHGANIEASLPNGSTPLFLSAYFGYDEMAKLLLDHGANKDVQVNGTSAFQIALINDHPSTAIILAGSQEQFCNKIIGTVFKDKYSDICDSAYIDL